MKKSLLIKCLYCILLVIAAGYAAPSRAQVIISGHVYDSSKLYAIPDVLVQSTSGAYTVTDTTGDYQIGVNETDSLAFIYQGKSTIKFAVKDIPQYNGFDISLHVKTKQKYKILDPVTVFYRSYREDSLEKRQEFANIFNSTRPGLSTTYDATPGGAAGIDLDELVRVFQFRKNKQTFALKQRLIENEQEKYVDYRFSARTVGRITGLKGDTLTRYMKIYRPSYQFARESTIAEFYEYILRTSYAFKRREGIP